MSRDEIRTYAREMGATQVADQRGQYGPGAGWVVFADPEGDQFCVLRSRAEVEAGPPVRRQRARSGDTQVRHLNRVPR
jgi:hypothetical protein